jgi:hypothetical protein
MYNKVLHKLDPICKTLYALYAHYMHVGYMQGICRVYIEDPTCLNTNNIYKYILHYS